ncbi:DUF2846 domain-containing protein [Ramlibacter sp. AW1]|uniref:DUF2846 domain-containing protein n=1 Tax=Ramlibacter aurantiacus TaxID=2801330 RepID=A0A936ZKS3_9BURK|nr:DUF2846 domain-containing protein [Ramlibacter aurantiacus]MBL0423144.1 DUF2846 domain-containing protein [Ramlibacter aurantiacus]
MKRRVLLACVIASALLAQGCAATGPVFASLQPSAAEKGQVYLYRQSALYAVGSRYKVRSEDGSVAEELPNASYLLLPLSPGPHRLSVEEASVYQPKTFDITIEAGRNYFVEYDSSRGLLVGWGLLSRMEQRSEAEALAHLQGLRRAN